MKLTDNEIIQKYGKPPVIEAFTPSLADFSRLTTRSGLGWDMAGICAAVTNAEGQKYALLRIWEKTLSGVRMTGELDEDVSRASPRVFKRQYSGPIRFDVDDPQMLQIQSSPSRHNFKVDIEEGNIHWEEENGALNVDLKILGPAMMIKDQGDEDYEDMIATSQMFEIKGTLNGENVSGLGVIDQSWLSPGIGLVQSKWHTHIETTWMPWITRYDDGSIEYGVIGSGAGDWHWGFYVKDGIPVSCKRNTIDTKWGDAGGVTIPLEADIQYDDHKLKWVADGRMNIDKGHLNWVSGKMINTEKTAAPVETYAWHEFRPV